MTYYKSAQKVVSFTPDQELSQLIWDHCCHSDRRFRLLVKNPQEIVRDALLAQGIIPKAQGGGDRSKWEPGAPIKVTLWAENAAALAEFAEHNQATKQKVMASAVADYINDQPQEVTN